LEILNNLTGKEHIKLVSRGNKAILYALRIAKKLGKNKLIIQDQGGWITYTQFGSKLKFDIVKLKTDFGLILLDELEKEISENSVLLVNSLSGYFAEQDMDGIYSLCKSKNCFVINDISGSIGTEASKLGDISVASFGLDKPLNYGKGGLIAVADSNWFSLTQITEEDLGKDFEKKALDLESRLFLLKKVTNKVKKDLANFEIIHRQLEGINVVVKFNSIDEKKKVIGYCKENEYEYTECPRYIRVLTDAISIEVKRL